MRISINLRPKITETNSYNLLPIYLVTFLENTKISDIIEIKELYYFVLYSGININLKPLLPPSAMPTNNLLVL